MSDISVRVAAFEWLGEQVELHGDVLPRELLARGFSCNGERVPLLGPQGIFKPRITSLPLSITTVADGPYADTFGPDEFLRYKYRGTDPFHRDNVGLREAMTARAPLVYFHGIVPGNYLACWPVFVVADDPRSLTFTIAVDDRRVLGRLAGAHLDQVASADPDGAIRRGYVTTLIRRRIHQRAFRERVLAAYRQKCALCRLRHRELLDAAHIIPDRDPEGEPRISNGIALCNLHHAAFDKYFLSIRPDYVIEVRRDVLLEEDGPTLRHGLEGMHGQRIQLPGRRELRPDVGALEQRHRRFVELSEA